MAVTTSWTSSSFPVSHQHCISQFRPFILHQKATVACYPTGPTYRVIISSMHQHKAPFDRGYLCVSDKHSIYYEVFGNPDGKPAVFLHGGPGAGCFPRHASFFDPSYYRITLFDQRGCGKSTPRGCLEHNTTWDLVDDVEKLRIHLRVNKWLVMGGSWGVTLALAYGETYPDAVSGFILRGICMLRQKEIDWFYKQGANLLFPFAWDELVSVLDSSEQTNVIPAFYKRLTSNNEDTRSQAAYAWLKWEMGLSFFSASDAVLSWDGKQYSSHSPDMKDKSITQKGKKNESPSATGVSSSKYATMKSEMSQQVAQARLECHYFVGIDLCVFFTSFRIAQIGTEAHTLDLNLCYQINAGFLKENQLLKGVPKIRHIPCVIVQGRYDFVCPLKNAYELHQAWPEAKLRIVGNAGHSMYEKGIMQLLIAATEELKLDL